MSAPTDRPGRGRVFVTRALPAPVMQRLAEADEVEHLEVNPTIAR